MVPTMSAKLYYCFFGALTSTNCTYFGALNASGHSTLIRSEAPAYLGSGGVFEVDGIRDIEFAALDGAPDVEKHHHHHHHHHHDCCLR